MAKVVPDRSQITLEHYISENVSLNSKLLCTDGWASYNGLTGLGYAHGVVIYNQIFINPVPFTTP